MKTPKTYKSYLKLLLLIADDRCDNLSDKSKLTDKEIQFLGNIRAGIQNELGEDEHAILKKHGLEWKG